MKWSLLELRKYQEALLTFHETLDLKAAPMKRDNLILDVAPVGVEGLVLVDKKGYIIHYVVQTTLTAPSIRPLEPVKPPTDFSVDEIFMTEEQLQSRDEQMSVDEILLIEGPLLSLTESIEDNILLTIPIWVLTKEEGATTELPKGNDWEAVSEEECQRKKVEEAENKIDPRLAKLSELFDSRSKDDDNKQDWNTSCLT